MKAKMRAGATPGMKATPTSRKNMSINNLNRVHIISDAAKTATKKPQNAIAAQNVIRNIIVIPPFRNPSF